MTTSGDAHLLYITYLGLVSYVEVGLWGLQLILLEAQAIAPGGKVV